MPAENRPEIPLWRKIVFGIGDVYAGGAQQLVGFLYLFYLTDVLGLRPALAGLAASSPSPGSVRRP